MERSKTIDWTAGCAAAAAVAVLLTGCTRTSAGRPEPADDAFPDPSGYSSVTGSYQTENTRQYFAGDTFSTPGGQRCSTNVRDYLHRLWCHGPRPDAPGDWDTTVGPETAATSTRTDAPEGEPNPDGFRVVPAGHRIDMQEGMVCVVRDGGFFACRAGAHGFVFTPTGTRLF